MGNREGHKDLTKRLTAEDIRIIYKMIATGKTKYCVAEAFHISATSVDRVMDQANWTDKQKVTWDISTMPKAVIPAFPVVHEKKSFTPRKKTGYKRPEYVPPPAPIEDFIDVPETKAVIAPRPDIREVLREAEETRRRDFVRSNQFDNVITALQLVIEEVETLKNVIFER